MAWIFILIAGLVLGAVLIGSRTARVVLIALATLLVAGAAYLVYDEQARKHYARTLISADEVELRDARMERRGSLYYLVSSVKNLSQAHSMASLRIRVRANDCPAPEMSDACEIVGDEVISLALDVPPQQVRGINELAPFAYLPEVENLVWSYQVAEVRAHVR